jgi:hypothetical protein
VCIVSRSTLKELLHSLNHFYTVLSLYNDISQVDAMQSVLVSLFLPDKVSAKTVEHRNQSSLWRSQHRLRPRLHRSFRCRTRPLSRTLPPDAEAGQVQKMDSDGLAVFEDAGVRHEVLVKLNKLAM